MNREAPVASTSDRGFLLRERLPPEPAASLPLLAATDREPSCEEQSGGVDKEDAHVAGGDQGRDEEGEQGRGD
jgi:hypothetical protein